MQQLLRFATAALFGLPLVLAHAADVSWERFAPIPPSTDRALNLPQGFSYRVMAQEGMLLSDGQHFGAWNDLNALVPLGDKQAYWVVNHETAPGGASVFLLARDAQGWQAVGSRRVDFSGVRGRSTWLNCSGNPTPWGTVLSAEENPPDDAALEKKRASLGEKGASLSSQAEDYGWMVEIDPRSGKALRKLEALGRFSHEGAVVMPDRRTVYMGDDVVGGLLFKFIADTPDDLTRGVLYALDRDTRRWLEIPNDQVVRARDAGIALGATPFDRLEDIEYNPHDGYLYIAETGDLAKGGDAQYGRVLRLHPGTLELQVFIQGKAEGIANPDNLAVVPASGEVLIMEDRYVPLLAPAPGMPNNSAFIAGRDGSYRRFATAPLGSEPTGGAFAPDGTLFLSIQHPAEPWVSSVVQIFPTPAKP